MNPEIKNILNYHITRCRSFTNVPENFPLSRVSIDNLKKEQLHRNLSSNRSKRREEIISYGRLHRLVDGSNVDNLQQQEKIERWLQRNSGRQGETGTNAKGGFFSQRLGNRRGEPLAGSRGTPSRHRYRRRCPPPP